MTIFLEELGPFLGPLARSKINVDPSYRMIDEATCYVKWELDNNFYEMGHQN